MVNYCAINENNTTNMNTSRPYLFSLSTPICLNKNDINDNTQSKSFYNKKLNNINFTNQIKLPSTPMISAHFTFLEPFESYHVSNSRPHTQSQSQLGKLNTINTKSARQQPYTLAKPVQNVQNLTNNDTISSNSVGFNQNAILARLSSISSTFKSIFVRPKNSKLVDLNSINNKKLNTSSTSNQLNSNDSHGDKFKLNLFSLSEHNEDVNRDTDRSSYDINNKIEKIISNSVQLETYKSHLIKANKLNENTESMVDEKCLPSSSSSASSSSSTISTLSTTSNLTNNSAMASILKPKENMSKKMASEAHQRAAMMANTIQVSSSPLNSSKINNSSNVSNSKWTCLICLSKHRLDVKVCSICGSQQTIQASSISNKSNLNMNKSHKLNETSLNETSGNVGHQNLLKSINNNVKMWTCMYCNYANDSLKIVCMNCRSSKLQQHLEQENSKMNKFNLTHQTIQTKRNRKEVTSNTISNGVLGHKLHKQKLNTSNEENELNVSETETKNKKAKHCDHCCSNCSGTGGKVKNEIMDKQKDETEEVKLTHTLKPNILSAASSPSVNKQSNFGDLTNKTNLTTLITPIKPSNYDKFDKYQNETLFNSSLLNPPTNEAPTTPKTTISSESNLKPLAASALTSSKWTCSTCLVQNDESKLNCACCSSAKPGSSTTQQCKDQVDSVAKPLASTLTSSKWTCSTCLVSNEPDKDTCVCCMSKKEGSKADDSGKTKFSSLVAAAGSLNGINSVSSTLASNISFGLKASSSSEPIKFGSSSSMSIGFSFPSSASTSSMASTTSNSETITAPSITFGSNSNLNEASQSKPVPTTTSSTETLKFGSTFGTSSTTTTEAPKFGFASNSTTTSSNTFGSTLKEAIPTISEPPKFGFGSSSTNTSNTFGSSSKEASSAINEAQKVGFGSISTNTTSIFGSSSKEAPKFGFGSSSSNTNSGFGQQTSSSSTTNNPAPILFGGTSNNVNANIKQEPATSTFGFGSSQTTTSNSNAFTFGSNNNTNVNQPPNSFPIANPFGSNETNSSNGEMKPSGSTPTLFQFGFQKSSTTTNSSTANSNNKSSSTTSGSLFGNSSTSASAPTFGFAGAASKQTEPQKVDNKSASSAFSFGSSSTNQQIEPSRAATTPFMFGSSTTNANFGENKIASGGTSVFGSTSSTPSSSVFAFGSQTNKPAVSTTTPAPSFTFGNQQTENKPSSGLPTPSPFVFGGSQTSSTSNTTSSAFNFGGSSTTNSNLALTPSRSANTPGPTPTTPFVFGGLSNNQASTTTDSPSLQQVLAGNSTPSTRLIKKGTRRLKK